jgi:hypothetical protein
MKISLKRVRRECAEGRFFKYESFNDKILVSPSIIFVWLFVNLGMSGNAVSWVSGAVAILGGILLSSTNSLLIFLGSFSYVFYHILDYADGGVARLRKESGIEGQYVDWIMHVISSVAISSGIFIGALRISEGFWLVPFGILFIVASSLYFSYHAFGWWSVCMYYQQNKVKNTIQLVKKEYAVDENRSWFNKVIQYSSTVLFHVNYAEFLLPLFALFHIYLSEENSNLPDFRIVLTIFGGTVYFWHTVYEITKIARYKKLEQAYSKLFFSEKIPDLPKDHFF